MKSGKFFINTFGCQMNARDSEVITGLLLNKGYSLTADPLKSDILLFNTCSVRQHAEDKVWSEIGRLAKLSENKRKPLIGLLGCMAQNYKDQAFERSKEVDFVVGPSDIEKIPDIIDSLQGQSSSSTMFERKIWETDGEVRPEEIYHSGFYEDERHGYVVISEGCSNFCSYCVVPFVRGPLRHRRHKDILKEIREALDKGVTRITLLGQNVNAYKDQDVDFIKLLGLVNGLEGVKEFSFVTSHPKDASLDLFKAMADCERLKKYLHLPVQSGSDRILKAMNRGYRRSHYLKLADSYRKLVNGGALSTDIIVGFPQETEKDFQDTYDLVKSVAFESAFIFKYSPRPNTQAQRLNDDVPKEEKEKRHGLMLDLQKTISKSKKHEK